MCLVTLVSGGLDSTLMALMAHEEGIPQFPLFVNYGQICVKEEWNACLNVHSKLGLPRPVMMDLKGYGKLIPSGLTDRTMRVNEDVFLPGRNLLFLLAGCAYAYARDSNAVAIGLLSEESLLFPDQTAEFVKSTQLLINLAMNANIEIITPLIDFTKRDVLELCRLKGIEGTYSCHTGKVPPCGSCVSCQEIMNATID